MERLQSLGVCNWGMKQLESSVGKKEKKREKTREKSLISHITGCSMQTQPVRNCAGCFQAVAVCAFVDGC